MPFRFEVTKTDPSGARLGRLTTPHGTIETPAFMPVGTAGTVKAMTQEALEELQIGLLLANTYHLYLRPGHELVRRMGGLHRFMSWERGILTDSGGYQVFSLADLRKITDEGVRFRSHLDGTEHLLTPEKAIQVQRALGSDIGMVLDECIEYPAPRDRAASAARRTLDWARRSHHEIQAAPASEANPGQAFFAIVQGGTFPELRRENAAELVALDFPGYAIGGLGVGEEPAAMYAALDSSVPLLPSDRPRYLMGLGRPIDLIEGVLRGVDLFDCVMPTRNGRNAMAFTSHGLLRLRNACHLRDRRPLDEECECPVCRQFSRGYLRHLFMANEMLGPILLSLHNVAYYQRLMTDLRDACRSNRGLEFRSLQLARWETSV